MFLLSCAACGWYAGGLFPSASHEYEVFRFALAQQQDIPKLVPQVDMVDTGSSFAMTYAYFIQQTWDLGKTELRAGGFKRADSSSKWTVARGSVQHTAAGGQTVTNLFVPLNSEDV
ncbi:Glutamate receptor 1 [Dissostichus eleginoides]|uniref:Glutamate receptor 1 n=1 Tax=Dissostichus eleginoides TaxID=100907 RepID=A0AAD9BEN9_DISEL|nr:Glutamate receptor 1 [Dissostichus eleginoides]